MYFQVGKTVFVNVIPPRGGGGGEEGGGRGGVILPHGKLGMPNMCVWLHIYLFY